MNSEKSLLILQNRLLHSGAILKTEDLLIVDFAFTRECLPGELIGQPEALLTGHYTKGVIVLEFIVLIVAEHLPWEHALVVLLGEHSVAANVLEGVIAQTIALHRHDNSAHLMCRDSQGFFTLFPLTQLLWLCKLCQVVLPLHVSGLKFLLLGWAGKAVLVLFEEL